MAKHTMEGHADSRGAVMVGRRLLNPKAGGISSSWRRPGTLTENGRMAWSYLRPAASRLARERYPK
jgi:hypothetical protein